MYQVMSDMSQIDWDALDWAVWDGLRRNGVDEATCNRLILSSLADLVCQGLGDSDAIVREMMLLV